MRPGRASVNSMQAALMVSILCLGTVGAGASLAVADVAADGAFDFGGADARFGFGWYDGDDGEERRGSGAGLSGGAGVNVGLGGCNCDDDDDD